jgi:hypothetical protein
MRKIMIAAACVAASACMHTGETAEMRETARSNAEQATAAAAALPSVTDVDVRAATCSAFLTMSINDRSAGTGYDQVAMEQARSQWQVDLRSRLSQMEMEQFIASTSAVLQYAARPQRDRAANFCVQNAPDPS